MEPVKLKACISEMETSGHHFLLSYLHCGDLCWMPRQHIWDVMVSALSPVCKVVSHYTRLEAL